LQFLLAGVQAGEKALYVTLSESKRELEGVAASHGWDISQVTTTRPLSTYESSSCLREGHEGGNRPVAPVLGFAGELRQLVANLVGNAVDAMRFGGTLQIRIREFRVNGRFGVRLTVSDSGSGIPAAVRSTLFEPFVSTKGNTGTGLGLWVSGQIVQRHCGTIRVKSKERVGTTFSVFLSGIHENVAAAD
jgi:signal transduction histidine kinase